MRKAIYLDLTREISGGIARYKPIRLDRLARAVLCAAETRGTHASPLNQATELLVINTDIREIKALIKQAQMATAKAVLDGDLTVEAAAALENLAVQKHPQPDTR